MLGQVKLAQFKAIETMPQEYQTAWDAVSWEQFTGAKYKPLLCAGEQVVHGVNYFYVAEQTVSDANVTRRLVLMAINERDGEYFLNVGRFKVILE